MLQRRGMGCVFVFAAFLALFAGCASSSRSTPDDFASVRIRLQRPASPAQLEAVLRPRSLSSIGEMAKIEGLDPLPVVGFGLVTGLGENGALKNPSSQDIQDAIKKVLITEEGRLIREASEMVRSRDSSMVQVTAEIPPGAGPGMLLDVTVRSVDAATSIDKGYLHKTPLRTFITDELGFVHTGDIMAHAEGQVNASVAASGPITATGSSRTGVMFSGARYEGERILILRLPKKSASGRRVVLMQYLINKRFANVGRDPGTPPINYASAMSDQDVFLRVPSVYRRYTQRFADVVSSIKGAYFYGPPSQQEMEKLASQLLAGTREEKYTASVALEAVGPVAIPVIEEAAAKGDARTKLYAGQALSYIGSPNGADMVLSAAESPDEEVRYEAVSFMSQLSGRRTLNMLRAGVSDESPRVAIAAVRALLASPEAAAGEIRMPSYDLVAIPATDPGLIVKFDGRPMIVITGPGTFLTGSIKINLPGIGMGSIDEKTIAVVAGPRTESESLTVPATIDNILTLLARYEAPFEDVRKVIAQLEDGDHFPYSVTWFE